jgi:hypothetical protein
MDSVVVTRAGPAHSSARGRAAWMRRALPRLLLREMFASSSSSSSSSSSRLAAAPRPSSPFFSTASHRFEKTRRWRRSPDGSAPPGRSARLAAAADDDDVEAAAARDPDPDPDPAPPCAPRPRKQQEQRPRRRGADRRALTRDAPLPPPGRSFAEIAIQQAGDHVHPSHRIPEGTTRPCVPETYRKRAVALLLGYVGRDYRGNTVNPALPRGSTVDDVLGAYSSHWSPYDPVRVVNFIP